MPYLKEFNVIPYTKEFVAPLFTIFDGRGQNPRHHQALLKVSFYIFSNNEALLFY